MPQLCKSLFIMISSCYLKKGHLFGLAVSISTFNDHDSVRHYILLGSEFMYEVTLHMNGHYDTIVFERTILSEISIDSLSLPGISQLPVNLGDIKKMILSKLSSKNAGDLKRTTLTTFKEFESMIEEQSEIGSRVKMIKSSENS